MRKVKKKNSRGITLIALVITIIVLLILAGVSIATLTGDNGILEKAKQGEEENKRAEEEENWKLGALDSKIEEIVTGEVTAPPVLDSEPGVLKGTGTQTDPFLIESIEDLVEFSEQSNSGNYFENQYIKLKQTLDFNDDKSYASEDSLKDNGLKKDLANNGFKPIAHNIDMSTQNLEGVFLGTFDGNNCTLKNIKIKSIARGDTFAVAGLFGGIGPQGKVNNLNLAGDISIETINQYTSVGALAAINVGKIQSCTTKVKITGTDDRTGNSVTVGGAIGYNIGEAKELISMPNISVSNIGNVGGAIGNNEGIATKLVVDGNITATDCDNVGGISGVNMGTVMNCKAQGKINVPKTEIWGAVGGIAGVNSKDIINNINNSSIDVTNNSNSNNVEVGGIVGAANENATIINCYNKGKMHLVRNGTGQVVNGGLIGTIKDTANIENCYFNGSVSKEGGDISIFHIAGWATGGTVRNCKYKSIENAVQDKTVGGDGCTPEKVDKDDSLTDNTVLVELNNYIEIAGNKELVPWKQGF